MAKNWPWQRVALDLHGRGIITDQQFNDICDARQSRVGRKPTPRTCGKCKQPVLLAFDHDTCALLIVLEPHALTPHGEIWALQNGRHTYEQQPTGIRPRNQWNIPGRPPTTTLPVFPTHTCGHPVPEQHRLRIPKKPTTTPVQHDGHFPF